MVHTNLTDSGATPRQVDSSGSRKLAKCCVGCAAIIRCPKNHSTWGIRFSLVLGGIGSNLKVVGGWFGVVRFVVFPGRRAGESLPAAAPLFAGSKLRARTLDPQKPTKQTGPSNPSTFRRHPKRSDAGQRARSQRSFHYFERFLKVSLKLRFRISRHDGSCASAPLLFPDRLWGLFHLRVPR